MRSIFTFVFCVLISGVSAQDFTEARDPAKVLEQIRSFTKDVKSFRSPFNQTKELALMMNELKSSGKLLYSEDFGIRWEYTEPNESVLVMADGKTMLKQNGEIRDLAGTNAIMKRVEKMVASSLDGSILTDGTHKTTFYESETQIKAELFPQQRRMQEMAQKIEIIFDKQLRAMVLLALTDSEGDRTIVEFTKPDVNATIDSTLFRLK